MAVAIFAMGMLFASSRPDSKPAQSVTSQQAETRSEKAKLPDDELTGSTWFTKDAAGFFTFWLVVVGIGQFVLFYVQLRLIRMSLAPAEQAAKAAQAAAEHIPRVERAYIFVKPKCYLANGDTLAICEYTFYNHGKTPAVIIGYGVTVRVADLLQIPDNSQHFPIGVLDGERVLPAGDSFTPSEESASINRTEWEAIEAGKMAIFFWGSIEYQDVFGNQQFTFYRWEAHGRPLRFAVVGGPPHNHRT